MKSIDWERTVVIMFAEGISEDFIGKFRDQYKVIEEKWKMQFTTTVTVILW